MKFKIQEYVSEENGGNSLLKHYVSGSWIIDRNGAYKDMGFDHDVFEHWAGDWVVIRNHREYGTFKTFREAKAYVKMWLSHNPKDV